MSTSTSTALRFPLKHHHGAISVPDLGRAVAWYRRVLGFELETEVKLAHIPAQVATLRRGDLRIELFHVAGARPASPDRRVPDFDLKTHGNKHFAFAVPDLDKAVEQLRALSVDVVFAKRLEFAAFAFIRDEFGNLIEFIEQPDLWQPPAQADSIADNSQEI
jgi:methylmalonyl-CoA/ethylmalonyl-CoA epimerase